MKRILVRVLKGHRVCEGGGNYTEGQQFWIMEDRLRSIADMVERVPGMDAVPVHHEMIEQPKPSMVATPPTGLPDPDPLKIGRKPRVPPPGKIITR